jgi:N-acetylneuraminate synthase
MEFSRDQWLGLKQHADDRNLLFLSTPFSERAADILAGIGMKVWKIASGEVGNLPLLEKISAFRDPIILSSGMSDWDEIDRAVETVRKSGNELAVLQCTSAYPCPPESVGLNMLDALRERYNLPVGLSDHSGNIFAGLAAVTLGAEVLEVHVTLSRQMFGPDVPASVTTTELRQLVNGVRQIERMIASPVDKGSMARETEPLRGLFTKSVVAGADLAAGTTLERGHLKLKKPGTGLDPSRLPELIGRRLNRPVSVDEFVRLEDTDK